MWVLHIADVPQQWAHVEKTGRHYINIQGSDKYTVWTIGRRPSEMEIGFYKF
jgi:hypothetical protein